MKVLTPEVIGAIRAFLERTTVQGREVAAYNQVMMALAREENEYRNFQEATVAAKAQLAQEDVAAGKAADGPG